MDFEEDNDPITYIQDYFERVEALKHCSYIHSMVSAITNSISNRHHHLQCHLQRRHLRLQHHLHHQPLLTCSVAITIAIAIGPPPSPSPSPIPIRISVPSVEETARDFNWAWLQRMGIAASIAPETPTNLQKDKSAHDGDGDGDDDENADADGDNANTAVGKKDGDGDGDGDGVIEHPCHEVSMMSILHEMPTVQALAPIVNSIGTETKKGFAFATSAFSAFVAALPDIALGM